MVASFWTLFALNAYIYRHGEHDIRIINEISVAIATHLPSLHLDYNGRGSSYSATRCLGIADEVFGAKAFRFLKILKNCQGHMYL